MSKKIKRNKVYFLRLDNYDIAGLFLFSTPHSLAYKISLLSIPNLYLSAICFLLVL